VQCERGVQAQIDFVPVPFTQPFDRLNLGVTPCPFITGCAVFRTQEVNDTKFNLACLSQVSRAFPSAQCLRKDSTCHRRGALRHILPVDHRVIAHQHPAVLGQIQVVTIRHSQLPHAQ
ncbi:hypothetical protein CJF34_22880, partial [Pseudomonas lundensis]